MGVVVSFDYDGWAQRYTEFDAVSAAKIQSYFTEATLYHANDGSGPVKNSQQQQLLLWMVTAHICKMNEPLNGDDQASDVVGHINSVTEGGVSVSVDNDYPPGTPQWWQQTKYGSAYWQASAQFRTFRYRGNPNRRNMDPWLR